MRPRRVVTVDGADVAGALRRGDRVRVRFGSRSSQLAEVMGPQRDDGRVPMRKWRARSRRWTTTVLVQPSSIVGLGWEGAKPRDLPPEPTRVRVVAATAEGGGAAGFMRELMRAVVRAPGGES